MLDLFVTVPSGAVAPTKYKPLEVDAINQDADGREQWKRVTFDCRSPTLFVMARGSSVEDRSKRN